MVSGVLETTMQEQDLTLAVPEFVVAGPNSAAETLITVTWLAIEAPLGWFLLCEESEEEKIMEELRPKVS